MGIRILHAADFHMDSPFDALPPEKAARRRQEQRDMLGRIAQLCRSQAQILLLAGDLLDSAAAYYETKETLSAALGACGAHVFIAPGNHDWYTSSSPYADVWPENVHIFHTGTIEEVVLPDLGCRVCGAAFRMDHAQPMLDGYTAPEDGLVNIMVLHGDLKEGPYATVHEQAIAASNLDYLALGHVHTFSGFLHAGKTTYAYPGCPEGRGFDETGEKGVIMGTVDKGACDLRFVPLPGRRYVDRQLDLTGKPDAAAALEEILPADGSKDICRITLTGEAEGIDLPALTQRLESCFFHAVLRDRTRPVRDIWAGLEEDTLRGVFLRKLRAAYDTAQDADRQTIEAAVRYGLAAMENREEPQQ
jgi:exonuclease SbcD